MSDTDKKIDSILSANDPEKEKPVKDNSIKDKKNSDDVEKKKDHPSMKKENTFPKKDKSEMIGGGGLMEMLKSILPMIAGLPEGKEGVISDENPFSILGDDDMDDSDPVVNNFKNEMGGSPMIIKVVRVHGPDAAEHIADTIEKLQNIRQAIKVSLFREAFAEVIAARDNDSIGKHQAKAVSIVSQLMRDASTAKEHQNLASAKEAILSGDKTMIDAASFRLRNSYASYRNPARNLRLAYTTLDTQFGEGYVFCPKSEQVGRMTLLEASKARENCIDCNVDAEGKLVCGYSRYLERIADNNSKVNARLEVHKNPANKDNLLTLEPGKRSNPATYNEKNYESRLEASELWTTQSKDDKKLDDKDQSLEARLRGNILPSMKGSTTPDEARKALSQKKVDFLDPGKDETIEEQMSGKREEDYSYDDETIEKMLESQHSTLTDEELEMLADEWLSKDYTNEPKVQKASDKGITKMSWYDYAKNKKTAEKEPAHPAKGSSEKAKKSVDNPESRTYKHDGPIGESIDTRNKSKNHTPFHLTNMEVLLQPSHMEPTENYDDAEKPDEYDLTNKSEKSKDAKTDKSK